MKLKDASPDASVTKPEDNPDLLPYEQEILRLLAQIEKNTRK